MHGRNVFVHVPVIIWCSIRPMSDSPPSSKANRFVTWGLHTFWRFSRGMTLGVRAVVLDGQGRVFLIRHT